MPLGTLDAVAAPPPAGEHVTRRFARAAVWSVAAAALSRGLNLAANVLVARALGAESFGKLGIVSTTTALFLSLGGMGMTLAATQQVARHRSVSPLKAAQTVRLSVAISALCGLLAGAVVLLFAEPLAERVLKAPGLAPALRLAGPWIFFGTIAATQSGILSGLEEFRALALLNSARAAVSGVILAAGALAYGVLGAVGASAVAELCGLLIGAVMVRRACARHGLPALSAWSWEQAGPLFHVGLLGLLGSLATMPAIWLSRLWLIRTADGYLQAGFYEAANKWALTVLFLPSAIGGVLLPILSNLDGSKDHSSYARVLRLNLLATVGVCAVPALFIALLAKQLMALNGPQYVAAAPALIVLALATVPTALNTTLGQALVSRGRLHLRLLADWSLAITLAGASFFLASRGAIGLALAAAAAYTVALGVLAIGFRRGGAPA